MTNFIVNIILSILIVFLICSLNKFYKDTKNKPKTIIYAIILFLILGGVIWYLSMTIFSTVGGVYGL